MLQKILNFLIISLFLEFNICFGLHLTSLISQNGIHGEITFYQDPFSDGKIIGKSIYVTVNLFHKNILAENETWTWYIAEYPVDYSLEIKSRCDRSAIGDPKIDLGNLFGPITFFVELNQTYFEFETGNETFSLVGENGIWGHSLVLLSPSGLKSCGTISVTDEYEERVAEAKFHFPVSGSIYFRWAGSYKHNVSDNVIFSNLIHVTNHTTSKHGWKIFVTDILDSEADKAREKCDFLQIVLNLDESNTAIGDLTSRLGEVTVVDIKQQFSKTSKSIFRDQELSSLPADLIGGSRSLYLVLFDDRHTDSFLACSKIRYHKPVIVKALIQSKGIEGTITISQRTKLDPTWLFFNISSHLSKNISFSGYQINEYPIDLSDKSFANDCSQTGVLFNPTSADKIDGSLDVYAIGDLSGKHGSLDKFGTVISKWDINLPLFGRNSIVHRSLVLYREFGNDTSAWVCGNLMKYTSGGNNAVAVPMSSASVIFRYPIVGSIIFRQPKNQPWTDTTIIVEYLIHADGINVNDTFEHRWSVNDHPPGKDFYNWTKRCLSSGEIFNPYKIPLSLNKEESLCAPNNLFACRLGDMSGKQGFFNIAGGKKTSKKISRKVFTDVNLPLSGSSSIIGRSLVIYDDHGPLARGDRLACSKIFPIYRRKAVVKSWHGNGEPSPVSGKFEFLQQTKFDITNIDVSVEGLVSAKGYHIHIAPVQEELEFPCEDSTVYGHFNPRQVNPNTSPKCGTPDQYEVGDLSGKFENFENKTTVIAHYNDSSMTLFGSESILGRSIVIHKELKNRRWVCASIERGYSPSEARELRAIASFHHPGGFAYGYIRITQLIYKDGAKSDSVIEVNLRHPGKQDKNYTTNHNWAIYVNPVSVDASVKVLNTRCTAGGYVWNPYFTQLADPLNEELYKKECGPDNPFRCYLGDISARLGTVNLGGKRQIFSDLNVPLEGDISVMGRSIVIFTPNRGSDRFACANIEPDKDIIKYVNIRKTPRFVTAAFLDEVREIMGVPEWFVTIDARKTKLLYNGNCIQFLMHFKGKHKLGPAANKLEKDFSILMATGKLYSPSLYIPGYNPSSTRKTTLTHGPCGSEDPQEKKLKKKYFSKSYSKKIYFSPFCLYGTVFFLFYLK